MLSSVARSRSFKLTLLLFELQKLHCLLQTTSLLLLFMWRNYSRSHTSTLYLSIFDLFVFIGSIRLKNFCTGNFFFLYTLTLTIVSLKQYYFRLNFTRSLHIKLLSSLEIFLVYKMKNGALQ